jgi:hypothetical protein
MRAGLYGEVQPQPMTQLPLDPAVYAIRRRWMSMYRWFSMCRRGRAFDVYGGGTFEDIRYRKKTKTRIRGTGGGK